MNTLPKFENLLVNYPTGSDPQKVIDEINPAYCNNPDYANTCTMRISKALNYCPGNEIPRLRSLLSIKGVDGKRYAVRVKEMKKYLLSKYPPPKVLVASPNGVIDSTVIKGKKGIISFDVSGWSDASGHFTLWDGEQLVYAGGHDYFNLYQLHENGQALRVTKCTFWQCP